MIEIQTAVLVASVMVFAFSLASVIVGWTLCRRSTPDQSDTIDKLLKANQSLQNKLVADSLPAYAALQQAETAKMVRPSGDNGAKLRPAAPADRWGRDFDEITEMEAI